MRNPESKDLNARIGKVIRALRKGRRLNITQLAARANVSGGNISALERGQYGITVPTFCRIARALDVDPGELLTAATNLPEPANA